ncbi:HNH endonuclease [Amycolatopsis sp. OK19-0408]|uniref:HNH endonuclease n=1 Tax=Amycolatopsis iheyensis TaxID=2945988 RepID=A0A9X2N861_9PSEU|nr:HNH endonuclease [Amycolatopsis iheyensis]MCR6482597.1 HNH endonuclease [Amycolatopsis iheyensis]
MRKPHEIRVDAERKAVRAAAKSAHRCAGCETDISHLRVDAVRCPECQRKRRNEQAVALDRAKNLRLCRDCDEPFTPKQGRRTCDGCAHTRQLLQSRRRSDALNEAKSGPLAGFPCHGCGEPFDRPSRRIRHCAACALRRRQIHATLRYSRRRAREPDTRTVEHRIFRRDVFERDAYTCHICHRPTTKRWRRGEPLSPVLDHVIPLSSPLSPGHVVENVATAHATCNARKHNVVRLGRVL